MNYQIIATLGPGSAEEDTWRLMLAAGANSFRLNSSHLTLDELAAWLEKLEAFRSVSPVDVPVIIDLQGSKWRLGELAPVQVQSGENLELVFSEKASAGVIPVPHSDFFEAAQQSNGEILLNDAKVRLAVEKLEPMSMRARVLQGGELSSHKGITFPASNYRREKLSEKDRSIITATRGFRGIRYALSYVKDAAEMANYRAELGDADLIAKLEREQAIEEAIQIAAFSTELWVCRGDLGAELGMVAMAEAVHRIAGRLKELPVPVLLAGQILEHMVASPTPTRSEVCCLYEALVSGFQGFVLSDEIAIGCFPIESVRAAAVFRDTTE